MGVVVDLCGLLSRTRQTVVWQMNSALQSGIGCCSCCFLGVVTLGFRYFRRSWSSEYFERYLWGKEILDKSDLFKYKIKGNHYQGKSRVQYKQLQY